MIETPKIITEQEKDQFQIITVQTTSAFIQSREKRKNKETNKSLASLNSGSKEKTFSPNTLLVSTVFEKTFSPNTLSVSTVFSKKPLRYGDRSIQFK